MRILDSHVVRKLKTMTSSNVDNRQPIDIRGIRFQLTSSVIYSAHVVKVAFIIHYGIFRALIMKLINELMFGIDMCILYSPNSSLHVIEYSLSCLQSCVQSMFNCVIARKLLLSTATISMLTTHTHTHTKLVCSLFLIWGKCVCDSSLRL